ALGHDPYDEVALRALMRAHLGAGRPASALAAYARVRHSLAEDLGVPLTAETEALHGVALTAADGDAPPAPAAARPAGPERETAPSGRRPGAATAFRTALVGRARELAALDGALAEAASGATPLVVVSGEAGMGKTALVEHWAAQAAPGGAVVLRGQCDELGRDLPLQPVADALADHLRSVGAERAAAIVGSDDEILAALLGPVVGSAATVVPQVETSQLALFTALARAVTRAANGGPVILIVEDLHQGGPSTVAWLAFARHRCPGALLVGTSRSRDLGPLADGLIVRLAPLTVEEVTDLVGAERASELHERTGGHPLLLAAVAPLVDRIGEGGDLPASVRDAVGLRVDSLGGEVAATLRVAAILGVDCDVDLLAEVRRLPTVDVLDHLEAASQAGLVVERGATFAFGHDLVRDALAGATGAARRALVHRDAARVLSARPRPDVLAVAVHARQGGDLTLAASAYVDAGEAAAARFDVATAEEYLEQALALDATPRGYAVRARVRMSRLALDEAAADADQALAGGGGAVASEVAGWVAYYQRHYDDARAHADRALAEAADPALRASALALAGRVRHAAGDLPGAVECLTTPVPDAPAAVSGVTDVWLGQVRNHQGRPLDALQVVGRAARLGDGGLAHPWASLHLRWNRAVACGQLGRVADAVAAVAGLEQAIERGGPVGARFRGPAANIGAWLLRWSGCADEADDRNAAAVEMSGDPERPAPERMPEAWYVGVLDLADGCLLRADPAAAAGYAARLDGLRRSTVTMAWHQRHRLGLVRARLALVGGDAASAAELAAEVAGDAAARGAGRYEMLATAVLGLADPAVTDERLDTVMEGLGRCAVLDGWPLVAALAAARGVDRWRRQADSMVAQVVASSGDDGEPARRLAARVLERVSAAPLGG
ncbi:MAG TPA: AAA family ATPase, partial [Acidimicrobiia bacterium]|nr:AAA family ATPase [Acidimicrobiia bacterium]